MNTPEIRNGCGGESKRLDCSNYSNWPLCRVADGYRLCEPISLGCNGKMCASAAASDALGGAAVGAIAEDGDVVPSDASPGGAESRPAFLSLNLDDLSDSLEAALRGLRLFHAAAAG